LIQDSTNPNDITAMQIFFDDVTFEIRWHPRGGSPEHQSDKRISRASEIQWHPRGEGPRPRNQKCRKFYET